MIRIRPRSVPKRILAPKARCLSVSCPALWGTPSSRLASLPIDVHPEVQAAQAEGRPVVALESTLITHGLPQPHSFELPKDCEAILRRQGVTPATIAILGGRIKVGLESDQLDELAEKGHAAKKDGGAHLWKVGRRELGAAIVKRMDGGTTVSGTMAVAYLAGIKIFSTGGIGGVHRGAETSFDISSDLISLADTPVAVVCAGSKSILDIGLTLEYLEAHAVPVAALGTSDWPAFYSPRSGFKAPMQLDSARQVAETILATEGLGLPSSLLLGVPIPQEYHEAGEALQEAVEQAVRESVENGMSKSGKLVTPWLLGRVAELTKDSSVDSNKALIKNNVRVGGEIAIEYAKLLSENSQSRSLRHHAMLPSTLGAGSQPEPTKPESRLVVIGSLAIDITMQAVSSDPHRTTAPGRVALSLGGVAGNVSGAARSLGIEDVLLVAPVGRDLLGSVAREGLAARGMRTEGLQEVEGRTATCGILLDKTGDLFGGVADMEIATMTSGDLVVDRLKQARPAVVCLDGNVGAPTMEAVLRYSQQNKICAFFEPTSNAKSLKILQAAERLIESPAPLETPLINYATPNIHELSAMYNHVRSSELRQLEMGTWFDYINVSSDSVSRWLPAWVAQEGITVMAVRLLSLFGCLFVKSGDRGVVVVQRVSGADAVSTWKAESGKKGVVVAASSAGPPHAIVIRHYPALELAAEDIRNVTGAGDNLAGALLACLVSNVDSRQPKDLSRMVDVAQRAAVNTLKSSEAVGDHSGLIKEM